MADHVKDPDEAQFGEGFDEDAPADDGGKQSYSKGIVALMIVTIIAFTVACLVFYWNGKAVDAVLIGFFFGCFGFEFGSLAFIKSRKLKYVGGNAANKQVPHVEIAEEDENNDER